MGFLQSLFSGQNEVAEDVEFTRFFNATFGRYFSLTGNDIEAEIKDNDGNVLLPQIAFAGSYEEYKQIQSVWDRQSVLFSALDQHYLFGLEKWKALERFLIDRYPDKGIKYMTDFCNESDFENSDFLTSVARCLFVLSKYEKGIEHARKAVQLDPSSSRAKLALGDLLHLTGEHFEAHALFNDVLVKSELADMEVKSYGLSDLVSFNKNIINSSVYAVGLLKETSASEADWDKVAPEFYFCPYFRSQHAFYLIQQKESLRGLAKLVSLAQEFPTYRDGVVNAYSVVKQYQQQMGSGDLMKAEEVFLKGILEKNGW